MYVNYDRLEDFARDLYVMPLKKKNGTVQYRTNFLLNKNGASMTFAFCRRVVIAGEKITLQKDAIPAYVTNDN